MSFQHTVQYEWRKLNQATLNVAAGVAADVDTYALSYGTSWTATTAAQNPANWPQKLATRLPIESNGIILRFLVHHGTDADNKTFAGVLWGRQPSNGVAFDIARFTLVQGGAAVCQADPVSGASITGASEKWNYCDTVTATANRPLDQYGSTDGIAEVAIDQLGIAEVFFDFNLDDATTGTKGTDAMVLYYMV